VETDSRVIVSKDEMVVISTYPLDQLFFSTHSKNQQKKVFVRRKVFVCQEVSA